MIDLIESASALASSKADAIKTHHNDTELVRQLRAKGIFKLKFKLKRHFNLNGVISRKVFQVEKSGKFTKRN